MFYKMQYTYKYCAVNMNRHERNMINITNSMIPVYYTSYTNILPLLQQQTMVANLKADTNLKKVMEVIKIVGKQEGSDLPNLWYQVIIEYCRHLLDSGDSSRDVRGTQK